VIVRREQAEGYPDSFSFSAGTEQKYDDPVRQEQWTALQSLANMHRQNLQVLEQQRETFGANVPDYITAQIDEAQRKVAQLEAEMEQLP
jgi:hypothetical protein